jgi:hypothetical protein
MSRSYQHDLRAHTHLTHRHSVSLEALMKRFLQPLLHWPTVGRPGAGFRAASGHSPGEGTAMTWRRHGGIAATARLLSASGILLATPVSALELDELTVVTLAHDGSWGVATAGSTGEAIAAAVRACRAMAREPTGCGAHLATTRGRWVIASLCGDRPILVSADTREDAEAAAIEREIEVRRAYVPELPPCRRVLSVDPAGAVATAGSHHSARAKPERLPP